MAGDTLEGQWAVSGSQSIDTEVQSTCLGLDLLHSSWEEKRRQEVKEILPKECHQVRDSIYNLPWRGNFRSTT